MATLTSDNNFFNSLLTKRWFYFGIKETFKEHGSIEHEHWLNKFWELICELSKYMLVELVRWFVRQLLESSSSHVNNKFNLINLHFANLLTFLKLLSPCVLELFIQKLNDSLLIANCKELVQFYLTHWYYKNWSSLVVDLVEAIREKLFDIAKLHEFMIQYHINLQLLSPCKVITKLLSRGFNIEVMANKIAHIETSMEHHFVYFIHLF